MKLAIVNITGGGLSGGYLKYLKNMIPRLSNHKEVEALTCIFPNGVNTISWFRNLPKVEYWTYRRIHLGYFLNTPTKEMRVHLLKFSPDILFIPTERYIRFNNIPVVNMVQNMEPHVQNIKGDPMHEVIKKYVQRKLIRLSVKQADKTIAVSNFVENYLTTKLDIPANKIHKVYHGMMYGPKTKSKMPLSVPLEVRESFLFTCGSIRPARGIEDALDALLELKSKHNHRRVKLVIAGETVPGMEKYRAKLERSISLKGLSLNVFWAGFLDDAEMSWCYNRCSLFIMTSRVEACPNIAIEAMSHGALTIAADNPPLPEFFSDCATYYQPGNGKSLANSIIRMLALDRKERNSLSNRTREISSRFSWDLTAEKTMHVFRQASMLR